MFLMKKVIILSQPVIGHFLYEAESWQRLLAYQREELFHYKNRLTDLINSSTDGETLQEVERFHEDFLEQDRVVDYLSDELRKQNRLIEQEMYGDGDRLHELELSQLTLRREFEKAEQLFAAVRRRFVQYLNALY